MLDFDNHVKICDFGLTRDLITIVSGDGIKEWSSSGRSATGSLQVQPSTVEEEDWEIKRQKFEVLVATLRWMAPEYFQLNGKLGPGIDVWAYGCTLIELFANKAPYEQENYSEIMVRKFLAGDPPAPPLIPPNIPGFLAKLIERTLRIEPKSRPSISQIAEELDRVLKDPD